MSAHPIRRGQAYSLGVRGFRIGRDAKGQDYRQVAVKPRRLGRGYKATVLLSVIDSLASQDLGLDEPDVKPVEMRRSKADR